MARAERIHHEERKKAEVVKVMKPMYYYNREPTDREIGRQAHSPKLCSCAACCNKRSSPWTKGKYKLTLQERRIMDHE